MICPPYVFVEVLPVLDEEKAKRLVAALKPSQQKLKNETAIDKNPPRQEQVTNPRRSFDGRLAERLDG
jgi:hypothetical protein